MTDIDKDKQIEQLKRKVSSLIHALSTIDKDVHRVAEEYLNYRADVGQLRFADFLKLLICEIEARAEEKARLMYKGNLKAFLTNEVERRLEEKILALVPTIAGKLSDYITLQVLIIKEKNIVVPDHIGYNHKVVCRALSIHGNVKSADGATPEEAYAYLRERFAVELFRLDKKEMIKRLGIRDTELLKRFNKAEPFMTDDIEGYKIDVRIT